MLYYVAMPVSQTDAIRSFENIKQACGIGSYAPDHRGRYGQDSCDVRRWSELSARQRKKATYWILHFAKQTGWKGYHRALKRGELIVTNNGFVLGQKVFDCKRMPDGSRPIWHYAFQKHKRADNTRSRELKPTGWNPHKKR